jgi:hypothetical protein
MQSLGKINDNDIIASNLSVAPLSSAAAAAVASVDISTSLLCSPSFISPSINMSKDDISNNVTISSKQRTIRHRGIIVAIDFGTSRSGFAYSLRSNPSEIATEHE